MILKLLRTKLTPTYTEGELYIDNVFFCHTIEDKVRNLTVEPKVKGQTAIPQGTYTIIVNMSNRFKRELPLLLDVPYFEGIRIHSGNTAEDSEGCILVGIKDRDGHIAPSRPYADKITQILKEEKNKKIQIIQ